MTARKIEAMHAMYGVEPGEKCRDCCNFGSYTQSRTWYKCVAYGDSHGASTDWAGRYTACGLFDIPFENLKTRTMIQMPMHAPRAEMEIADGQIKMEGT